MATVKGAQRVVSDMDEHSKLKADARAVVKEAMDGLGHRDDSAVSAFIARRMNERHGPTWHAVVGDDFKAAISHESKQFIFITSGKSNVLLYKCG